MAVGSNSLRPFWLTMVLCLYILGMPEAQSFAASQTAAVPSGYRIAGTVVSKADGRPLARARITVRDANDPKKFLSIVTAEDGKFEFTGLPAGKYSLTGARRGFISASYDQHDQYSTAIVTGAELDTETLVLRLAPDAVITGKVLDEFGEPVRHATVQLYFDDHSRGVDQIRQSRGAQTDDLGEYEFTPLRPGTYFLSVSGQPWYAIHPPSGLPGSESGSESVTGQQTESPAAIDRSLDVAYPITYYPDAREADDALPIPIRGGERVEADFHLNPVPSLRLRFRMPDDGKHGYSFPQLEQPTFDGSTTFVQGSGGNVVAPAVMEITGIPAGRYNVRLRGETVSQMNGVDLEKDGEEIDTSKSDAVSSVKFAVQIPAEPTLPPHLTVGLRSGNRMVAASQAVDSKGEAELQQVTVGKYEVMVWGGGKPYSISHISAEGAELTAHTLNLAAGSAASVSLTLVGGSVEVQGTAKKAGSAVAGAMVVLVPQSPETDHDLFRRDQSDLDGTFSLHNVVPGRYTLLAIENGWDLDWSQPGVIGAYLKRGRKIQVNNQAGRPTNIVEAIEVQYK
ncbi:MAG TPA: carboxypeptidase-like regulatory domain-containing protein [Candidatus Eremiobacteraceae bacterium]|nr:carboxypeptidase-like regulatory domain-containing protein [Candidatus Eremiobacteraceae bacterium]